MPTTDLVRTPPRMTLDVTEKPVVITGEQTDLIRRTIAADATDAELALFFYDCQRRGVHPLDKLIHFTKRKGKYTPVTSIDFFRARAAQTREHMGTDDVCFTGTPGDADFAATVTVYRRVQGEKCAFIATARLAEYMPEPPNDFMWRKMPHGQLGKCAEALALRKGFPQELEGLHTVDELDRAASEPTPRKTVQRVSEKAPASAVGLLTAPGPVKDVRTFGKDKANYAIVLAGDATEYTTKNTALALEIEKFKGTDHRLRLTYEDRDWQGKTYHNLTAFQVVDEAPSVPTAEPLPADPVPPMTAGEIPFGR